MTAEVIVLAHWRDRMTFRTALDDIVDGAAARYTSALYSAVAKRCGAARNNFAVRAVQKAAEVEGIARKAGPMSLEDRWRSAQLLAQYATDEAAGWPGGSAHPSDEMTKQSRSNADEARECFLRALMKGADVETIAKVGATYIRLAVGYAELAVDLRQLARIGR